MESANLSRNNHHDWFAETSQPAPFAQISQAIEMKIVPGHGFSEDRRSQLEKLEQDDTLPLKK